MHYFLFIFIFVYCGGHATFFIDTISITDSGTSSNDPIDFVCTVPICSTAFIPATTFPKTAYPF